MSKGVVQNCATELRVPSFVRFFFQPTALTTERATASLLTAAATADSSSSSYAEETLSFFRKTQPRLTRSLFPVSSIFSHPFPLSSISFPLIIQSPKPPRLVRNRSQINKTRIKSFPFRTLPTFVKTCGTNFVD